MTAVIVTEKLTKSYGAHRGIIEVDLEVQAGEIFGFLGWIRSVQLSSSQRPSSTCRSPGTSATR
jgi:hypothetical protein